MDSLELLKQAWEDRPFNPGKWVKDFVERMFVAWKLEHDAKVQLRKELVAALRREIREGERCYGCGRKTCIGNCGECE